MNENMIVEKFVDCYYKRSLFNEFRERKQIIAAMQLDFRQRGRCLINSGNSLTGRAEVLINPRWRPKAYLEWCIEV